MPSRRVLATGLGAFVVCTLLPAGLLPAAPPDVLAAPKQDQAKVDFTKQIEPIFRNHCNECHGQHDREAGLRLDVKEAALAGAESGAVIKPGDSAASRLFQLINGQDDDGLLMPPEGEGQPLSKEQIALVRTWIDQGADWPADPSGVWHEPTDSDHWCFKPVEHPPLPAVENVGWGRTAVDRFVMARLEQAGMKPAAEADRITLVRRLSLDLLGLPPTPAEIEAFLGDERPDAYERLVDRLLASPRYGERWGQHWLDVVRFSETEGFEYDRYLPGLWRYRDYIINSFNEDRPFDRLVWEQIAGDEIGPDDQQALVAAGFYRLGPVRRNAGNQLVASSRNEVLTERTDMIGSAFLGLTLGCARCHNHKFDPIPQKDYYRLQAALAATHEDNRQIGTPEELASWKARTEAVNAKIAEIRSRFKDADGKTRPGLVKQLKEAQNSFPDPPPTICTIQNAEDRRTPIHVLQRGDWERKGDKVGMRVLSALAPDETPELPQETENPRSVLAEWIADPDHPLTARVLVNRIWHFHFGQGIVNTPNDFGTNGDRPSHPLLLDFLAGELVDGGWRMKPIHRQILLSNTYRQDSRSPEAELGIEKDPTNRLLWRFNRRMLQAEEIRDSMLAISGKLNLKAGGQSVIVPVDSELVKLLYKPTQWSVTEPDTEQSRRSVYLIAKRNLRVPFMEVFDQPTLQTSCPSRFSSTHAPQALELLNGRTSNALAAAFAGRLMRDVGAEPALQVQRAYLLAAGRQPTPAERRLALEFLQHQSLRELALAMFNLNAFLYVN